MKEKISGLIKKIRVNERAINYLLIFILGFLVGVAVKTEARKRITIGYGDYLLSEMKQDFDLTKPEVKTVPEEQPAPNESESQEPADAQSGVEQQ